MHINKIVSTQLIAPEGFTVNQLSYLAMRFSLTHGSFEIRMWSILPTDKCSPTFPYLTRQQQQTKIKKNQSLSKRLNGFIVTQLSYLIAQFSLTRESAFECGRHYPITAISPRSPIAALNAKLFHNSHLKVRLI